MNSGTLVKQHIDRQMRESREKQERKEIELERMNKQMRERRLSVVYFDQLLGAMRTQKLVELLFSAVLNLTVSESSLSVGTVIPIFFVSCG